MYNDELSESINCVLMLLTLRIPRMEVLLVELPIFMNDVFKFVPIYKDEFKESINCVLMLLELKIPII